MKPFATRTTWPALFTCLLLLLTGCSTTSTPTASQATMLAIGSELTAQLDAIVEGLGDPNANVAVRVMDADTGETLYVHGDIDNPMKPASNMKLISCAIALEMFGPAHTYKTYLVFDGQDLMVVGTGDPCTGDPGLAGDVPIDEMFDDWAKALRMQQVTEVPGRLIIDDRAIDDYFAHPSWWPADDLLSRYGAPVAGLNYNVNCVVFTAEPTEPGQAVSIQYIPAGAEVDVINHMVTAPSGEEGRPEVRKSIAINTYTLSGTLSEAETFNRVPVVDPPMLFAQAMRSTFARRGVTIAGETVRIDLPLSEPFSPPTGDTVVAVHETPILDVLAGALKPSQNTIADCISKMNGLAFYQSAEMSLPGSWLGADRATRVWMEHNGIDHRPMVHADGSGLSHNNRLTVRLISDLLMVMHQSEHAELWKDCLTIGGVDGTLQRRFTDTPGRVYAKTGTLTGASALSGYVTTDTGRELVFSILVNSNRSTADARNMQDELVTTLLHSVE